MKGSVYFFAKILIYAGNRAVKIVICVKSEL